ncbi:MAG: heme-binding domain-containing protein [Saprospirales bacterium]|nr:heme-binding domain-containing protein [Saprospirales bacterium]MBK8921288.1 heme-binding domain-containing protein [Saprospirales bacterium]
MKKIFWLAPLGALLAIQFIRPDMSNPPVDPAQDLAQVLQPPTEVQGILKDACYDCHSNETKYPWYSQIAPVSWWLAGHIREGREKLNFSTIGALPAGDRAESMSEAAEAVQEGEMPLNSYTWTHASARLSDAQRNLLVNWLNANGEGEASPANGEAAESGHVHSEDD